MTAVRRLARAWAVVRLVAAQLRYARLPVGLAVLGVAVAVLLVTLLSGMGYGATAAGTEGLAWLDQDLWVSAGPLEFAPGAVGGVTNTLVDAHATTAALEARPDVASAEALAFQVVYVSPNGSAFAPVVGVGMTGDASTLAVREGPGFATDDVHYADGRYDGPMSRAVVVDERTAERFDVGVGDTLYLGGTISVAREHPFTVVGVASTFETFLGAPTVTLHLSELQTVTGATGADAASTIAVTARPGADVETVQRRLQRAYPAYDVRTNREQVGAVVGRQSTVLASAAALVAVAVATGVALVVTVLRLLVAHQRRAFAALRAVGLSTRTLVAVVAGQGLAIGLVGGVVGVALAPVAASWLNPVVADLSGFNALIKLPPGVLLGGVALGLSSGAVGAVIAGVRVSRLDPLAVLRE